MDLAASDAADRWEHTVSAATAEAGARHAGIRPTVMTFAAPPLSSVERVIGPTEDLTDVAPDEQRLAGRRACTARYEWALHERG